MSFTAQAPNIKRQFEPTKHKLKDQEQELDEYLMIKIPSDNFRARSLKGCCPTYLFIDPYKVIINNIKQAHVLWMDPSQVGNTC